MHHPFRNWEIVIGELRPFALKNLATYSRLAKGPEAIQVLLGIFFDAISHAPKEAQKTEAVKGILAFIEKIIQTVETKRLLTLLPYIEQAIIGLREFDVPVIQAIARNYHPVSRLIQDLSKRLVGQDQVCGMQREGSLLGFRRSLSDTGLRRKTQLTGWTIPSSRFQLNWILKT
ncbi:MAG: hypothetical protein GWP10_05375 [Nitrospiraceae bacterium]|nr:hypothetical protein [Nitrospiraceae bacterium]